MTTPLTAKTVAKLAAERLQVLRMVCPRTELVEWEIRELERILLAVRPLIRHGYHDGRTVLLH